MDENKINAASIEDVAFDNKINFLGRWTSVIALLAMFAVPVVVTLSNGIQVDWASALPIAGSLIAMFAPMAIVENISYYAVLGAGGVYLSCITGNIMNMKLPCALSGMRIAQVEPGSKKGDIIAIISIGVSSLVTTVILFLGMLIIGRFLAPLLENPILKPGFDNIMPALMGAIAIPFVIKSPKLAAFPVLAALALYLSPLGATLFGAMYQSYTLLGIMAASVAVAYGLHKKGLLAGKQEKKAG
jgi:hypothetical protein